MKKYFNYIQPSVIKMSNDEENPEYLRGSYFANVNFVGVRYFTEKYLLNDEETNTGWSFMFTDDEEHLLLSKDALETVIDLPRIYILITDSFVKSQIAFADWFIHAVADHTYIISGTEHFKPGIDYFINTSLANYLYANEHDLAILYKDDNILPDYIDTSINVTKYWEPLSDKESLITDFGYFRKKNDSLSDTDMEKLLDFMHTFFETLYNDAELSEDELLNVNNQIYKRVIEYFLKYESDEVSTALSLILGSKTNKTVEGASVCGCQSKNAGNTSNPEDNTSCVDLYKQAMFELLVQMFTDINFYLDWFGMEDAEGNSIPNEGLLDELESLIEDLLDSDIDLSTNSGGSGKNSIYSHCVCGGGNGISSAGSAGNGGGYGGNGSGNNSGGGGSGSDAGNRKTLENFLLVLEWVKNGCLEMNRNKIRVIGEAFAKLLPNLNFA